MKFQTSINILEFNRIIYLHGKLTRTFLSFLHL
uniref:Uncharacterized protein n=1 Tax=Cyanidioschyzon merolae (strain NIES-3377 / 10D) TaxID=280699 RepID=Q85G40_CYAM1|nr:ORF32 [Cyanidioschyzon merolae strain 10D]BAC76151.1 unnamed protein product [Cyanidioschyzon merolae strain 10D]